MFHDKTDPVYIRISLAFRGTVLDTFYQQCETVNEFQHLQVHFINVFMYLDMLEIAQNIIERDNPLH